MKARPVRSLDRRDFLKTTAATAAGAWFGARAARAQGVAPAAARPNIVFILADDQTPAYLSCYGGRTPTPNLDRLAREGALFTSGYSVSPLRPGCRCRRSRSARSCSTTRSARSWPG